MTDSDSNYSDSDAEGSTSGLAAEVAALDVDRKMDADADADSSSSDGGGGSSSSSSSKRPRVVIVPGNGCVPPVRAGNWYGWLEAQLKQKGVEVMLDEMPDPYKARESKWLPFMRSKLLADANAIVVGHSSGAEAAMRLAETDKLRGIVLVSACYTDLGMASETVSGYYSRPWQWEAIRSNTGFIDQFGSTDDPFIPWDEMQHVHENLREQPNYLLHKFTDRGHFMTHRFPELVEVIMARVNST